LKNDMTFGPCLKFILNTLNISMSQLAKAINVDSSLVNRWVHEERIPSDIYLTAISDFLGQTDICPIQSKLIDELINSVDSKITKSSIDYRSRYFDLLDIALHNSIRIKNKKSSLSQTYNTCPLPKKEICLSEQDKLIYGFENIYNTFLSLLDTAAHDTDVTDRKIIITYHNDNNISFYTREILRQLVQKLLLAIQNNWQVIFLLQSDINSGKLIEFFGFLLPLMRTEQLSLFYSNSFENQNIRKELYVVSGLGALSCFPSKEGIDCGFLITTACGISVLADYASLLVKNNTSDVIQYYHSDINDMLFSMITDRNRRRGNQYSSNNSLSLQLLPESLYRKYLELTDLNQQQKEQSCSFYAAQYNSFLNSLNSHQYTDIYQTALLERLCDGKVLYLYTCAGARQIIMETDDIILYLEHIIGIIKTCPKYNIAIVYNPLDQIIKSSSFYLRENQILFLGLYNEDKKANVYLSISEPCIIRAFEIYIISLWEKLPLHTKSKPDSIALLEEYIRKLQKDS